MKGHVGGGEISSLGGCPLCTHLPSCDGFLPGKIIFVVLFTTKPPCVKMIVGNSNTSIQPTWEGWEHALETAEDSFFFFPLEK